MLDLVLIKHLSVRKTIVGFNHLLGVDRGWHGREGQHSGRCSLELELISVVGVLS